MHCIVTCEYKVSGQWNTISNWSPSEGNVTTSMITQYYHCILGYFTKTAQTLKLFSVDLKIEGYEWRIDSVSKDSRNGLSEGTTQVRSPAQAKKCFIASACRPALGPTGGSFRKGKARPRRHADNSPPSSSEVKNG